MCGPAFLWKRITKSSLLDLFLLNGLVSSMEEDHIEDLVNRLFLFKHLLVYKTFPVPLNLTYCIVGWRTRLILS